jgi:hypothetical protein
MEKWASIAAAVVFGSLAISGGVEKYVEKQCHIEAIKAGVEADKIKLACGTK